MTSVLITNAVVIGILMLVMWIVSLILRNAAVVDSVWGLGFVLVAWATWLQNEPTERSLLLPVLTTIWGIRLSVYLTWRNRGKPEDFRYRAMRQKHGSRFAWVSLLTVFVLQGVIMAIVALPLQTSGCGVVRSTLMASVGGLVWLTGLAFETIGDWQLAAFKKNPENSGQVMDRGLWKYTRHPNYFGDFCVWWGLWLVAMASNAAIWSVVGPVVMSILLMKVSGVTLLEKTLVSSKPGYQQYASRTSAFFPLPVRKS